VTGGASAGTQSFVVRAATLLTPLEQISNAAIQVANGRVVDAGPWNDVRHRATGPVLDCGENTVVPGFVDVHIHGSGGWNVMRGPDAVREVSQFIAQFGVTSWLPTLLPRASIPELVDVIRANLVALTEPGNAAQAIGYHLEGPYLNPKRPGAIWREWFRPPNVAEIEQLLSAAPGWVRLMTLAPELPGGLEAVRALRAGGATASIGHSDARSSEALAAVGAGVTHATHTFNAMRPLHHRDPGVVGAVLVSSAITAELIADGVHVEPVAMQALIQAKGAARVALITDAVAPAGLPDGSYDFDGQPITVKAGKATLADGTIAGSVGTFDAGVRRVVRECGVGLADAALMAATVPARSVGVADRKGSITAGRDADLVVLDADLRVRLTMARGRVVYRDL
jgi:N-acetylglucosamine-6-phosphate deacetylase